MLKDSVIGKLLNRLMEVPEADIPGVLSENQLGISDALEFDTMEAAFASMLAGNAILLWIIMTVQSRSDRRVIQI